MSVTAVGVGDVVISPQPIGGVYTANQKLKCIAKGYPTPTVSWLAKCTSTGGEKTSLDPLGPPVSVGEVTMKLDKRWLNYKCVVTCIGTNTVNNQLYNSMATVTYTLST